jgi:transposase
MSLQTQTDLTIPEETARVAQAAFPKGNLYLKLRDELGPLYTDSQFAGLFAKRGRPAEAPGRLALVTVFQFMEGLTDRQAADAVRSRIDWKYALALELTDAGFDFSILGDFRARLIDGEAEQQLLDNLLVRFKECGWLKARGRQRTDSTHVLAAVRALNRLECVGETLRHTLNCLAEVAPEWVQAHVPAAWYERYAARFEQFRLPKTEPERHALALTIGADGHQLLTAVYSPDAPSELRQPAVDILRQVWIQHYYWQDDQLHWREEGNLPPGERLIQSPYDPEARYSRKRQTEWKGYKVHITETCDDDQPHLITHVETTPATTPDSALPDTIHTALADQGLLPREHLLDAGYVDAGQIVTSQDQHGVEIVGPVLADTSWQARAREGFEVACFTLDWEHQTATCPQGRVSRTWAEQLDAYDNPIVYIRFARVDCLACPSRAQCTRGPDNPRTLKLRQRVEHETLQRARQQQTTPEFKQRYAARAGIEGTLSQGTRAFELRQARYIGLVKTHLQHVITAVAINLKRIVDWLCEMPRAATRTSAFAALAPT